MWHYLLVNVSAQSIAPRSTSAQLYRPFPVHQRKLLAPISRLSSQILCGRTAPTSQAYQLTATLEAGTDQGGEVPLDTMIQKRIFVMGSQSQGKHLHRLHCHLSRARLKREWALGRLLVSFGIRRFEFSMSSLEREAPKIDPQVAAGTTPSPLQLISENETPSINKRTKSPESQRALGLTISLLHQDRTFGLYAESTCYSTRQFDTPGTISFHAVAVAVAPSFSCPRSSAGSIPPGDTLSPPACL